MPKKKQCDVIVGNIGTVRSKVSLTEAKKVFKEYVDDSKTGLGRGGNEQVTLMCDGEVLDDYIPEGLFEKDDDTE